MQQRNQAWLWASAILILSVIAIAAVYFWPQPVPPPEGPHPVEPRSQPAPPTVIENPPPAPAVAEPAEAPTAQAAEPLPTLAQSDPLSSQRLIALISAGALPAWFKSDRIIMRIVVMIDNLPRKKLSLGHTPLSPIGGAFSVGGAPNAAAHWGATNAQRYAPYVALIEQVDMRQAAATYRRLAPLFQDAYEQLGYPNARFEDRLIQVIDHLLDTPVPARPPALVQPKVLYEYADEDLESRSAGQKMLMRAGPQATQSIKAQLRKLREQLAQTLHRLAPDRASGPASTNGSPSTP